MTQLDLVHKKLKKLFRETDYNLINVRKTKLVQPLPIDHLPEEMKVIQGTKKKKNLFIKNYFTFNS